MGLLAAGLVVAQEPAGGQLDASRTLFSVMAALDAAAALEDPQATTGQPLRDEVRKLILAKNPPVLRDLATYVAKHRKPDSGANLAQYISFALVSEQPPEFAPRLLPNETPPDVEGLLGFRELMERFAKEVDIDAFWKASQPAIEAELERYHGPVTRAVLESDGYLRHIASGYMGRRFQIYVELLAPANQVHTRSYKDDYFIVVTHSTEPRTSDIRHAYLHFLLDPLATKYAEDIRKGISLTDYAQGAPALDLIYKDDFLLLATESLIKAVEARMDRKPEVVTEALKEGFILAPFFAEQLVRYEKQESAMRMFFPEMLAELNVNKENKRLSTVEFAAAKTVRRAEPPPQPVQSPLEKLMQRAEDLYRSRELDPAREAYLKLLRQTDDRTVHARAYYGLARIAALQRNPSLADELFRKTLEMTPDADTRAWTEVYLARLSEAAGQPDEAAEHYRAALKIEGATPGAKQAAKEGLQKGQSR
jgi:tetratricopeptide (TPR) repeat protein